MNVFTYGSLMYHSVWSRVVTQTYPQKSGTLTGFQRLRVKNQSYPGLIRGDDAVEGIVYFDLTTADLARLDRFEGAWYQRAEVKVVCADGQQVKALVYMIRDEYKSILNGTWSKTEFERTGLTEFEQKYLGFGQV